MTGDSPVDVERLALELEVAELRIQLAEAQDQLIAMAVDAGELQALIESLQAELSDAQAETHCGSSRRVSLRRAD